MCVIKQFLLTFVKIKEYTKRVVNLYCKGSLLDSFIPRRPRKPHNHAAVESLKNSRL
ncbi:MAG: hypothetical protein RLY66_291 [Candidatus Parcubacteria bacterium]|jgi:hypothetical protein